MISRNFISILTVFGLTLVVPAVASAGDVYEMASPPPTAPLSAWTGAQQYRLAEAQKGLMGFLIAADNLGDKLDEVGRARLIMQCFHAVKDTEALVAWAVCGNDVKALNPKKLEAELAAGVEAGQYSEESKTKTLRWMDEEIKAAKAIGAQWEAAAKDDSGVAEKVPVKARADWNAYLAKNQAQYDRYLALVDGIRSNKSNHPAFKGCWEQTQPPFAKIVKAAAPKIPWVVDGSDAIDGYLPGYMAYVATSIESYIVAASYGACSWSIDPAGAELFNYAMRSSSLAGPRGITVARLFAKNFLPKFADRSINYPPSNVEYRGELNVHATGTNGENRSFTHDGVVGKITAAGDMTKISFNGEMIDACIQWKEATRQREKHCAKRGMIPNEVGSVEIHNKFLAGVKPGVTVGMQRGYPVGAWKAKEKKMTALFTVDLP